MLTQEDRSLALDAVLSNAADMGVENALQRFGDPLTDTEKAIAGSLSKDDAIALKQISSKLGSLSPFARAANNNNNNNNRQQ